MRNWLIGLVALVLAGGGYALYGQVRAAGGMAQIAPTAQPLLTEVKASSEVVSDAVVVPVSSAELRFEGSGTVAELLVAEGDTVKKGDPLARLDSRDLELRVAQAKSSLLRAKASYDKLVEGATEEEIAQAQTQIAQAQAQQRQTSGNVTSQDVTAAKARIAQALAAQAELEAGAKSTDVQSARAALDRASASLQGQRDALSVAKTSAQSQIEQAANTLRDRQDEFSRLYWDNEQLRSDLITYGRGEIDQEKIDQEEAAKRAVASAEEAVEQAQLAYEQAQQGEITGIAAGEAQVRDAQAALDKLLAGSDADDLAAARAQVAQANAGLSSLQGEQRSGSLAVAAAGIASAEANLAQLLADPRSTDLAIAEAQVQDAEVALQQAELALTKATLYAPMNGTVAEINLEVGEVPGDSQSALVLADFSTWEIETDDLTELSIVHVRENAPVTITFDALPGFELLGTVKQVKPIGKNKQGDITYTVVVAPKNWDERLRWNMTASVAIAPAE